MRSMDMIALLKEAASHRSEVAEFDGELLPKSAFILISALDVETDSTSRFELYSNAILECKAARKTAAAVKLAQRQCREFNDIASLMAYSDALAENDEVMDGILRAKEALELAIKRHTLINYAAGNLVRQTLKAGSVELVDEALQALVESTQIPREGDCALETEWIDAAEGLGANARLISRVRSIAAHK